MLGYLSIRSVLVLICLRDWGPQTCRGICAMLDAARIPGDRNRLNSALRSLERQAYIAQYARRVTADHGAPMRLWHLTRTGARILREDLAAMDRALAAIAEGP